jgi:hypothetical protein
MRLALAALAVIAAILVVAFIVSTCAGPAPDFEDDLSTEPETTEPTGPPTTTPELTTPEEVQQPDIQYGNDQAPVIQYGDTELPHTGGVDFWQFPTW